MAMTTALNENRPTRPVVESCSKMGYGYLRPISKLIVTLVKVFSCTYHPLYEKHCSTQNQYPKAMIPDKPREGRAEIVHGGESNSKSTNITIDGTAWKPRSADEC
jgi:hypothetical protein